MEFINHKVTEAVCAFRFDPNRNPWDITYFASYFNLIKGDGFVKKNEIKPFQLSFQIKPNEGTTNPQMQQGEIQMVFKNEGDTYAILMGNNYISFHTINHYDGWDKFKPEVIEKFLVKYFSLGLGNGLVSAQMIYVNNFGLEQEKDLSDYLNFVPKMQDFGEGDEISHFFQSNYSIAPNKQLSLKTILNPEANTKTKRVILECNCVATSSNDSTWGQLSDDAHKSARNAFIKISTDYFKNLIK